MTASNHNEIPDYIKKDYPAAKLSRIGTGGIVSFLASPRSISELKQTLRFCHNRNLPFCLIGGGANILINDGHIETVFIRFRGTLRFINLEEEPRTVTAGAGTPLIRLGRFIAGKGYSGLRYMGAIPGTTGGAVIMNAGINEKEQISNNFLKASVLDPITGDIYNQTKENMQFGYRKSILQGSKKIIISATFIIPKEKLSKENALKQIKDLLKQRRLKQPKNPRTFGSTFKNPENCEHTAGWYLEQAGMKGMKEGGAMISEEHANWIVNTGNANSKDVKDLIETGRKRVIDKFGIKLEREVVYLP
jgi:UDP-N-acetylmuramate dehydrogenase